MLLHRPHRNHRPGTNIQRHGSQVDLPIKLPATLDFLFGPEVKPGAVREIKAARRRALFGDWRHQDITAPQVFVATNHRRRISRVVEPERPHYWQARLVALANHRIEIWEQPVAQL